MSFVAFMLVPTVLTAFGVWHNTSLKGLILLAIVQALSWSVYLFVILRFGLLALAFVGFFENLVVVPCGWGLTGWQSSPSWTALLILVVVVGYGFHTALAGRSIFRDELLET